jgi:hypothetical protein
MSSKNTQRREKKHQISVVFSFVHSSIHHLHLQVKCKFLTAIKYAYYTRATVHVHNLGQRPCISEDLALL